MAINAVSSAASNALQQQPAAARQAEFKTAERPRESDAANKVRDTQAQVQTQQTKQVQARQQVQEAQRAEVQRSEQPKPVVNAQGQRTGTILSTTA